MRATQDGTTGDGKPMEEGGVGGQGVNSDSAQGAALQSRCEALLGERKAMQARVNEEICHSANNEPYVTSQSFFVTYFNTKLVESRHGSFRRTTTQQ